jgi:hypothetical protein
VGDEVRALRRRRELGGVTAGTTGVVTAIDPDRQRLTIRWPSTTATLSPREPGTSALVHAYATTPIYARRHGGPVLAFGDVRHLAPGLEPTATYCLAPDPPALARSGSRPPLSGPAQDLLRRQEALGLAAEILPSRAVIAALGPVPAEDGESRRAWRQAARAIEVRRESQGLPDGPLVLDDRHGEDRRVLAACRAVERARAVGRELDLTRAGW